MKTRAELHWRAPGFHRHRGYSGRLAAAAAGWAFWLEITDAAARRLLPVRTAASGRSTKLISQTRTQRNAENILINQIRGMQRFWMVSVLIFCWLPHQTLRKIKASISTFTLTLQSSIPAAQQQEATSLFTINHTSTLETKLTNFQQKRISSYFFPNHWTHLDMCQVKKIYAVNDGCDERD